MSWSPRGSGASRVGRRSFVGAVGWSVAGAALTGSGTAAPHRLGRIGLELYSVRDAMRKDPEATLPAGRAIGYTECELLWSFGNFGRTPAQVRASLAKEGLRAPSAHISPESLLSDWPRSLDTAKLLRHQYLIVPRLPAEENRTPDRRRQWADPFNPAGAAARKAGVWLAFHNEPDHMAPVDGTVPYDIFVERTDPAVVRLPPDRRQQAAGG